MPDRYIERFRWPPGVEDKVYAKHGLVREEVEEAFFHPQQRRLRAGGRRVLLSRSEAGRYILVVYKVEADVATVITARDMTQSERRRFGRK
jgi:uncharacterized DUF497 family protein